MKKLLRAAAVAAAIAWAPAAHATVCAAFLMGLFGTFGSSPGVVSMQREVAGWKGYESRLYTWAQWQTAAAWLGSDRCDATAVVGYSNGGSTASWLAATGVDLDLAVFLDATFWLPPSPVERNVAAAVIFHDVNPFSMFPPVGHAVPARGATFRGKYTVYKVINFHWDVDTNLSNQKRTLAPLRALAR